MSKLHKTEETGQAGPERVFKLMVTETVTERVWYEVPGAESAEQAVALYRAGEAVELDRKHLSTYHIEIEAIYQEDDDAVSMD